MISAVQTTPRTNPQRSENNRGKNLGLQIIIPMRGTVINPTQINAQGLKITFKKHAFQIKKILNYGYRKTLISEIGILYMNCLCIFDEGIVLKNSFLDLHLFLIVNFMFFGVNNETLKGLMYLAALCLSCGTCSLRSLSSSSVQDL